MPSKGLQSLLKEYADSLSYGDTPVEPHYFPTGLIGLNQIIADNNARGFPGRSIIQIVGDPKNGKTTLAYDILARAQESELAEIEINGRKINAALLDIERSYDEHYARKIGIDVSKLFLVRTTYIEESHAIAEHLLLEGLQFILVDSVASGISKEEHDRELTEVQKMAAEATANGRFLKHINALMDDSQLVVIINQYRANLSSMARSDKKHYGTRVIQQMIKGSIRLTRIKNEDDRAEVEAFIEKTKFGPESRKMTFHIDFGDAIDYAGHILDLALEFGIVERKGAWYVYQDQKAQGADNAKITFPIQEIEQKVKEYMEKGA